MRFNQGTRGWLKHESSHTEQEVRFKNLKHTGRDGATSGSYRGPNCCSGELVSRYSKVEARYSLWMAYSVLQAGCWVVSEEQKRPWIAQSVL